MIVFSSNFFYQFLLQLERRKRLNSIKLDIFKAIEIQIKCNKIQFFFLNGIDNQIKYKFQKNVYTFEKGQIYLKNLHDYSSHNMFLKCGQNWY